VRPNTRLAYENELTVHLLPFFAEHLLSQITVAEVDRYRDFKVREAERGRATLAAWKEELAAWEQRAASHQEAGPRSIRDTAARSCQPQVAAPHHVGADGR
jgi:hypothetical protein